MLCYVYLTTVKVSVNPVRILWSPSWNKAIPWDQQGNALGDSLRLIFPMLLHHVKFSGCKYFSVFCRILANTVLPGMLS